MIEGVDAFHFLGQLFRAEMTEHPACWVLATVYMLQFPITLTVDGCMFVSCLRAVKNSEVGTVIEQQTDVDPRSEPEP